MVRTHLIGRVNGERKQSGRVVEGLNEKEATPATGRILIRDGAVALSVECRATKGVFFVFFLNGYHFNLESGAGDVNKGCTSSGGGGVRRFNESQRLG